MCIGEVVCSFENSLCFNKILYKNPSKIFHPRLECCTLMVGNLPVTYD